MTRNEQFVKAHWTQAITLGIVTVCFVFFNALLEDTNMFKKSNGLVKGEAVVNREMMENNNIIDYQNQIKNIIDNYLRRRAEFVQPHQDWLFLINNVKFKLLAMSVPDEYKELHLELVSTLDKEWQAVNKSDNNKLKKINEKWQKILNQYFWLD